MASSGRPSRDQVLDLHASETYFKLSCEALAGRRKCSRYAGVTLELQFDFAEFERFVKAENEFAPENHLFTWVATQNEG